MARLEGAEKTCKVKDVEPVVIIRDKQGNITSPGRFEHLTFIRGYISRRPLKHTSGTFRAVAHSAELIDAYAAEQAEAIRSQEGQQCEPVTRFLVERLEDRYDPMTDKQQPYIEIREVDIGEPFQKWYQAPNTPSETTLDPPKSNFYQFDKRSYEFFKLDGVDWTKQLCGKALDMSITQLMSNIQNTVKERYDLINNNCHGTREKLFPAADTATEREDIDQRYELQHYEACTHELPKFAIPEHILRGESKLASDIDQARQSESHRRAHQANQHRSTFARAGSNTYQETKSGNWGKALLGLGGLVLGGLTIYATGGAAAVVVLPQAGGGMQVAASFALLL